MTTNTQLFDFQTDVQGWVAYPQFGQGYANQPRMRWARRHHPKLRNDPWLGGALWTSTRRLDPSSLNYWELTTTFENLGVPAGAIVTEVVGAYIYRYTTRSMNKQYSGLVMSAGDAQSGPFQLRSGDGTLIGTFSGAINCPARTGYGDWKSYPEGYASDPIVTDGCPPSWEDVGGFPVSVSMPSDAAIKLRLYNKMPPNVWYPTGGDTQFLRHKSDRISITLTYTVADQRKRSITVIL